MTKCLEFRKSITKDQYVLNIVKSYLIEFSSKLESISSRENRYSSNLDKLATQLITAEIQSLLQLVVIETSKHTQPEFLSPVFSSKPDGSIRKILNLSN